MPNEIIRVTQNLPIKAWPLTKPGHKKFFGYVVAMGIFPHDWGTEEGMIPYADFAYSDSYERFELPDDKDLKDSLQDYLWENLNGRAHRGDVYGKVWIIRTDSGYLVHEP